MERMDNVHKRIEALEQQMRALGAHTHTVERRLRWWRGLAYSVMVLGLLSGALLSGKTVDAQQRGLPERVTALEDKLVAVTFNSATKELVVTGANLRIVNGLRRTDTTNGLGNLIVGYNEPRQATITCDPTIVSCAETRTGSHNIAVGKEHNFSSFGGLVVGLQNEISGKFASITGGEINTASGDFSSISGGVQNRASGDISSISGGGAGTASGGISSISGGDNNIASATQSWVGGGDGNQASGRISTVCGGIGNTASGQGASVSGGLNRVAPAQFNWAAGPLFADN